MEANPPTVRANEKSAVHPKLVGASLAGVLAALMITLLLSALDQTIVGTALPTIVADLNGVNNYTWVITAYLLTSTTVIPMISKLSDQFGRKWFLLSAVVIFLAGSALSGASTTMNQLIAFRALQGVGGGMLASLVFTLIGDIFTPAERAKWQGLFSGVFGLASVVGPTAGGWITDNTTWRWVFYVNVPFGILALFLLFFLLPANISARTATGKNAFRRIDWIGAFTSATATILLLLGLTWGGATYPWASWQVIGALAAAGVLYIAFIITELRVSDPILPLDLFKNQIFTASSLLSLTVGLMLFAVVIYLPIYLQGVLQVKATNSGLVITPLVVAMAIAAGLIGFLISRVGRYQFVAIIGSLVLAGGVYLLSTMNVSTTERTVIIFMIVLGIGLGLLQPVLTLAVQNAIPRSRLGAGTGAVTYLRTLGSTLGTAIVGSIVTNASEGYLNPRLGNIQGANQLMTGLRSATDTLTNSQALQPLLTNPGLHDKFVSQATKAATAQATKAAVAQATAQVPPSTPHYSDVIAAITAKVTAEVHATVPNQVESLFGQVMDVGRHALAYGIHTAFLASLIVAALVFIITLFLKDVPLIGSTRVSMAEGAEPVFADEEQNVPGEAVAPMMGATPATGAPAIGLEGV
ncbi:MAG TPA: MDR family MFS transporter [Ktedonobacterales bacterium]|nr:MDR family MFS transporter [Ktedonobacterales bacterium]